MLPAVHIAFMPHATCRHIATLPMPMLPYAHATRATLRVMPPYVTRHIATCRHMLPRYAATRYMPLCRIAANTFIHAAFDDTQPHCHVSQRYTLLMLPSVVRHAVVVIAITCHSRHDAAVNAAMTCCHTLRYMPLQMRRNMPHATCHAATLHCHTPHRHTLLTCHPCHMPHATLPPLSHATCWLSLHAAITRYMPHATCCHYAARYMLAAITPPAMPPPLPHAIDPTLHRTCSS
jgi:hypothetical protein